MGLPTTRIAGSAVAFPTFALLQFAVGQTHAAVIWDEGLNGDLGELYQYSNPQSEDAVVDLGVLGVGTSTLLGTNLQQQLSGGSFRFEGDAIRFTIAPGTQIDSILFAHNQSAGIREFLRLNGASVAQTYVFRTFPAHTHHSPNFGVWVGTDLLVHDVPGGGPLGPGEYLISWDNQTFSTTMQYQMDIVVTPTPGVMVAFGLFGLGCIPRRRR